MATTPVAFSVETAEELEDALNAALLPLTNERVFGVVVDQVRSGPSYLRNLGASFTYDSVGATALANPFQARIFSNTNEANVITLLNDFIAANPSYFFSEAFFTYRTTSPNPNQGIIGVIFYNPDGAAAAVNWGGSAGGVPVGPVGGDLSGALPNPEVVGIHTIPIQNTPWPAGGQITYDPTTNSLILYVVQVYASLVAAAAAQANQIIGQQIIIFNTPSGPDDGTWVLNVKTGNPADYTKISDATDLASEVALDAAIPPLSATNVFQALQQIVALIVDPTTTGTVPATTIQTIATEPITSVAEVEWTVVLQVGTARYTEKLHYTHDGTDPFGTSDGIAGTTFPFGVTLSVTLSGGNLNLVCNNTLGSGCDFRVKTITLPV